MNTDPCIRLPAGTQAENGSWLWFSSTGSIFICDVSRNFNQILIRVSEVYRCYWTHSTSPGHGTFFNGHSTSLQMTQEMVQRFLCDKADICRARNWASSFGLKLLPNFMQVKLLVAKT